MATYHGDETRIENPDGETQEVTLLSRAAELADVKLGDAEVFRVGTHYTIYLPEGTDVTALNPILTLSRGATVDKTGPQDFTNPMEYVVTAADGVTTKTFDVTIEFEFNVDDWGDEENVSGDDDIVNTGHGTVALVLYLLPLVSCITLMLFKKRKYHA